MLLRHRVRQNIPGKMRSLTFAGSAQMSWRQERYHTLWDLSSILELGILSGGRFAESLDYWLLEAQDCDVGSMKVKNPQWIELLKSIIQVPSCEDLLPHPKSHVNSIQEVISIDVLSTAAKALDFNRNSTTSDGACYPQPACAAILDTPVPSSHYEGKGFRDEIFETGITIFEDDLESHDLDTQRVTAPKAFGPRIVRASGSNHGSGPVVALQGTCRAPELHSEEVSLNQRTMEPDRPTITWLKDTNKFTGLRNPKTYGMTLNELFEGSQSSRGIASNSKYSMGSAEHVTSHHLRNAGMYSDHCLFPWAPACKLIGD